MLRTGQLRRAPPRPRDLARRRGPRYRGPWRLPGPDSHRLAAVSLALGYPLAPPFVASAPELLDAHSPGITARPEATIEVTPSAPGWEWPPGAVFDPDAAVGRHSAKGPALGRCRLMVLGSSPLCAGRGRIIDAMDL